MQFREIIKVLQAAGITILISSHVLSDLAELCTSIGIMELGYLVESASLEQLYQRLSRQQIFLSTLGEVATLETKLRNHPLVQDVEVLPQQCLRVYFTGDRQDCGALLRSLVSAGIPLTEFHCPPADLETIFLTLGHQQVS